MMSYMLAGLLLSGCAGSKTGPSLKDAGIPDFIQNPPQQNGALFGTGIASLQSIQVARETADLRARKEIASALSGKVANVLSDYLDQAGIGSKAEVEDLAKSIARALADADLSGLRIEKREPFKGRIYSLARYPLDDSMKKLVSRTLSRELSSRKTLLAQFQEKQAFDELDRELDKIKFSK
jgi:hypothetical protein